MKCHDACAIVDVMVFVLPVYCMLLRAFSHTFLPMPVSISMVEKWKNLYILVKFNTAKHMQTMMNFSSAHVVGMRVCRCLCMCLCAFACEWLCVRHIGKKNFIQLLWWRHTTVKTWAKQKKKKIFTAMHCANETNCGGVYTYISCRNAVRKWWSQTAAFNTMCLNERFKKWRRMILLPTHSPSPCISDDLSHSIFALCADLNKESIKIT